MNGIVNYLFCPKCKNILASALFTKIVCYKGEIRLFKVIIGSCLYCKKDYFYNESLEEMEFQIDMFEDEIDRKE